MLLLLSFLSLFPVSFPFHTYCFYLFILPPLIFDRDFFTSRADFSKEPAFAWMKTLSDEVKSNIQKSKVLFCNGYGFDELPAGLISSALEYAVEVNTSIFFDPGPKGKSLAVGTPEEQDALAKLLRFSDVLLLTSEEVCFIAPSN